MAGCQPPHGGAPVPPVRMVMRKNELAGQYVASQGFPLPGGVRAPSAARGYPPLPKANDWLPSGESKRPTNVSLGLTTFRHHLPSRRRDVMNPEPEARSPSQRV